jgi:hypothetical protein
VNRRVAVWATAVSLGIAGALIAGCGGGDDAHPAHSAYDARTEKAVKRAVREEVNRALAGPGTRVVSHAIACRPQSDVVLACTDEAEYDLTESVGGPTPTMTERFEYEARIRPEARRFQLQARQANGSMETLGAFRVP